MFIEVLYVKKEQDLLNCTLHSIIEYYNTITNFFCNKWKVEILIFNNRNYKGTIKVKVLFSYYKGTIYWKSYFEVLKKLYII